MADVQEEELTGRILFWDGLRASAASVPVWLFGWFVFTLLALVTALPWFQFFEETIAKRYEPGSLLVGLDRTFRHDHREAIDLLNAGTARAGATLAFVSMLIGVFFAGGWLQVFLDRAERQSLKRFFYGGSRYFWRFFRLLVLVLLLLGLLDWLLYQDPWKKLVLGAWLGVPKDAWDSLETLGSEWQARLVWWARDGLFALGFGLISVWAIYTRSRLAVHEGSSVLWSGVRTFFLVLRHPFRTLVPMVWILITQGLVIVGARVGVGAVTGGLESEESTTRLLTIAALFGLTQLVPVIWGLIAQGAQYFVAIQVCRDVAPPEAHDPWQTSIGGPGGPRYPIGGDDYGVSL